MDTKELGGWAEIAKKSAVTPPASIKMLKFYRNYFIKEKFDLFKFHDNDILIKNEKKLLKIMLDFHKNPNIDDFNQVINADIELYSVKNDVELIDEICVELENETKAAKKYRIAAAKKKMSGCHKPNSNFCRPEILVWANTAIKQFPWLIDACNKPLYLDRAAKFMDNTFYSLINVIYIGPVRRDIILTESVETKEIKYYFEGSPIYAKKEIKKVVQQSLLESQVDHLSSVIYFTELAIMQYGASGNLSYIENLKSTLSSHPELRICLTSGEYNIKTSDIIETAIKKYVGDENRESQ